MKTDAYSEAIHLKDWIPSEKSPPPISHEEDFEEFIDFQRIYF